MTQFTANEVRDAITWKYGDKSTRISAMLTAFADMLEAQEKSVPVMVVNHVSSAEHDLPIGMKLYTHPAPADAERLAEALPSDDWFANEICEARNHWHEHHEANWLETDDNHPDDFMGKWLRSKLLAAHDTHPQPAQEAKGCVWSEDEEGNWDTGCGNMFVITEGTPYDNEMGFCCYCGGKLDQVTQADAAMAKESGR